MNEKKDSCIFDGKEFSHGSEICSGGRILRCYDGEWEDTGDECASDQATPVIHESGMAVLDNDETKSNYVVTNLLPCIRFAESRSNTNVYLVNGCDDCKIVKIRWYDNDGEAFMNHKVEGRATVLTPLWRSNGEMVAEYDCE